MAHNETLLINGVETQVRMFDHSAQEIDAAVGRAVSGGALDTSVENVSKELGTFVRPNLLDNWYFGRPVNQRGVAEFSTYTYGLDRWYANTATTGALTYRDNALIVADNTGLVQKMEDCTPLNDKIVTISALTTDNDLFWSSARFVSKDHDLTFDSGDIIQFYYSTYFGGWQIFVKSARDILAVKLELGDTQTLAHQDSAGKWMLNEVPDYGEQLRRCQRYFRRLQYGYGYDVIGAGFANADNSGRVVLALDVAMRTTPSITHAPTVSAISGGTAYNATINSVRANTNTSDATLELSIPDITTRAVFVLTTVENNAYIDLSADL